MPNTLDRSSGLRRAAILLMSLPVQDAARVIAKLPMAHIESISLAIAQLDNVSGDEQEAVIASFLKSKASALGPSDGGLERAKELIRQALGDEAADLIGNVTQTVEDLPFSFVKKVDPQTVLNFINEEHAQTIALLLCHLPGSYGAEILSGLSPEKQLHVIRRISAMGRPNPDAVTELERGLEMRLSSMMNMQQTQTGGVGNVAEILNVCDRSVERTIMDALANEDPELMDEIRRLMFVFEDIVKLNDRDVQTLLKNVETAQWAMALKGSSEALQDKILRNMSSRAADNLREEMEYLGSVRVSDVEGVQQKIVDIIRMLEDNGELARPTGDDSEEYIN
jgi:flagellar motor switch protein FliG